MRRRGEYAERHPPATNPQHTTQGAHAVSPQGASPIGTPETRCGQGKAGVADQGSGEPSATRCVAVNPGAHNPALVGRAGSTRTHPSHTYSKESVVGASTGRARPGSKCLRRQLIRNLFSSSTPRTPATYRGTNSAVAKPAKASGRITKVEFASYADCTAGRARNRICTADGGNPNTTGAEHGTARGECTM